MYKGHRTATLVFLSGITQLSFDNNRTTSTFLPSLLEVCKISSGDLTGYFISMIPMAC